MKDFKGRVLVECKELEVKVDKLIDFMSGDIYPTLAPIDQGMLMAQLSHMKFYAGMLRDRIERF